MPRVSGDRFSQYNLSDCAFCPEDGRRFRTARQCVECEKPLCLVCRPAVADLPHRCPECGGGPVARALTEPVAARDTLRDAGCAVPFWLELLAEANGSVVTEQLIVEE